MIILRAALTVVLTLGLLAATLTVGAEQAVETKVPRLGLLFWGSRLDRDVRRCADAFVQGLRELGYAEGQVRMESRWAEGRPERLLDLARELVTLKVDVIVALSVPTTEASRQATKKIPVVMIAADPLVVGSVTRIARPAGNVTGLSMMLPEVVTKHFELLKEVVPTISRIAVLRNPTNPSNASQLRQAKLTASALSIQLHDYEARDIGEIERAFVAMTRNRPDALLVLADPMLTSHGERLVHLSIQSRLPSIYGIRSLAEAGGLLVYGADYFDLCRRAAGHVDKLLKGAKPADLPIEQPTKFELIINMKTAKALGLTIPPSLLLRADQVIE